jgi:hypothetical protein
MRFLSCTQLLVAAIALTPGESQGQGAFPELRPVLNAPKGFSLTFKDGPDFYTWVLAEDKKEGDRRSGIGIYFGQQPNLEHVDKKTAKRVKGKVCFQEVSWWVEARNDPNTPSVRRDVVIAYDNGKGFRAIQLHLWVWGPTEKEVAALARQLETLKFVARDK